MKPYRIKIKYDDINPNLFFTSKNGVRYLDLVAFPQKNPRFSDFMVKQSKPRNYNGPDIPIIGDMISPDFQSSNQGGGNSGGGWNGGGNNGGNGGGWNGGNQNSGGGNGGGWNGGNQNAPAGGGNNAPRNAPW